MKKLIAILSLLALVLAAFIFAHNPVAGFVLLFVVGAMLNFSPRNRCCVTLSVPELLQTVLASFKTQFMDLVGCTTDFDSSTATLNSTVTGHISHLPTVGNYDAVLGWAGGAANAEDLLEDVPIVLSKLKHVPVQIKLLTKLGSKQDLRPNPDDIAFTLVKYVTDDIIGQALTNISNHTVIGVGGMWLDAFEGLRSECNTQKLGQPRYCILNTALAGALNADDRTLDARYYGGAQKEQEAEGLRRWADLAGFKRVWEYPDFPNGSYGGLGFDQRLACLSVRAISDKKFNAAKMLGIQEIMAFDQVSDDSGLSLTGVSWQQPGTGDVFVSIAILYGLFVGTNGGAALSGTDLAGLLIKTQ